MDNQIKAAIISTLGAILIAVFFTQLGNSISHILLNTESIPVLTSFEPDKESPQMTGTQINWTAIANNPRKESLIYRFNLKSPSTNYSWKIVQNWGTQNKWSWHPTEPGNYNIQVQVSYGKINEVPDSKDVNYIVFPFSKTFTHKGFYLYNIGELNKALSTFDKAIAINPLDSVAWTGKGFVLNDLNKSDEAIKALDKAIEINPQYSKAWNGKGLALGLSGKTDEAIKAFDKAIEINPYYLDALKNKGMALDSLNKSNEALNAFDKALGINSQDSDLWTYKGNALSKQNKYEEAFKAYEKATEIDPHNSLAEISKRICQSS